MDNKFNYTYSAPTEDERKEIESIRKKYLQTEEKEDKIEKLRKLDEKVTSIPTLWSLVFGIVGTLIFGLGMAMILEWQIIVFGVAVCILGIVPSGLAYPVYKKVLAKQKKKYGDEIITLTNELLSKESE